MISPYVDIVILMGYITHSPTAQYTVTTVHTNTCQILIFISLLFTERLVMKKCWPQPTNNKVTGEWRKVDDGNKRKVATSRAYRAYMQVKLHPPFIYLQ